jgi:hypothetical protein
VELPAPSPLPSARELGPWLAERLGASAAEGPAPVLARLDSGGRVTHLEVAEAAPDSSPASGEGTVLAILLRDPRDAAELRSAERKLEALAASRGLALEPARWIVLPQRRGGSAPASVPAAQLTELLGRARRS